MIKYVLREMNDLKGDGENVVYPRVVQIRQIAEDEFVRRVGDAVTGLNAGMVEAALAGMEDKLVQLLTLGYSVKVKGLGTFSLKLKNKNGGAEDVDSVRPDSRKIIVDGVNFKADKELVKRINLFASLESDGVKRVRKVSTTVEERRMMALSYIDKHHSMSVAEYMKITGLSRTPATEELRAFRADDSSGIGVKGRGSHILYVRKNADVMV
jgi:predicted histone-like DNA-binding protein